MVGGGGNLEIFGQSLSRFGVEWYGEAALTLKIDEEQKEVGR